AAISMLEIAVLLGDDSHRIKAAPEELFSEFEMNPIFRILPLTIEVAKEVTMLGGALRDPADRAIVASARVHRLRLLTSDRRIIESNLVSVVV
ncbi:MAG TPA: PIN domain-containing protein, partial [Bryobacteraceae bacterium]|nr:PIN domain-containing protein [Bryobacteraceae bacterium]